MVASDTSAACIECKQFRQVLSIALDAYILARAIQKARYDYENGTRHLTVRRVASIVGRRVGKHYGAQLGESIARDIFGDGIGAMLGEIAGGIIGSFYGATRGRRGVEALLPPPPE